MFSRPLLADLVSRIRADIASRLAVDDPLRRADLEVHARVHAGSTHALYGYLDWMSRQLLPDTAEAEYLDRHASIWLTAPRYPAVSATGQATFTLQSGSVIPSGTGLRAFDGTEYSTTADATVSGLTATAPIVATLTGISGNRNAGQTLTLISPITGVVTSALGGLLSGGANVESDDALRARVLARIQNPPQGGAAFDYISWAKAVAGVTRAWVYPGELGAGTVTLRFMRDNDTVPIPNSGAVATVQAYINTLRPVTAAVTVVAPIAAPLNFSIALTPNTTTTQAAVQAALSDLIFREAIPGGTLLLSHINEAISLATGETDHVLSVPSANVVNTTGNISTMGTITWL